MYAGTKVNWHEVLMPDSIVNNDESLPLFLCAFSSDKGTEEITDYVYSDFQKMYGATPNFFKYGQPLLQAHRILNAGGRVLGKRIVADDATLANIVILAELSSVTENKTDSQGRPLYIDENGNETIDVTDTPATITSAIINYSTVSVENAKTVNDVELKVEELQTDSVFPLFIICDNGRGESIKKVRIVPDYDTSKKLSFMLYKLCDVEGTSNVEIQRFAVNPDAIYSVNGNRKNMVLNKRTMTQFNAETYTTGMEAFLNKLCEITGYTLEDLYAVDPLFGKTLKGKQLDVIYIDNTGIDVTSEFGLNLKNGSNGKFGSSPFTNGEPSEAWTEEAVKFFDGTFSDEIYDLDQHKIDFCCDANYPVEVKRAIVALVEFREDFYYFRDIGLNINSVADVELIVDDLAWPQSPFVGDYCSTYDIIDPYTRKQIKVTSTYGIAPQLVQHYATNVAAPIAGEFNNFIISDAVEGTLNIIPRVTPTIDQKEILDDLRVNFLNLTSDGLLAVQSTYTSQDHIGPLSYANNVIVTQMLIKAIRRYCPKIRFMLMDPGSTDFGKYKTLIEDNVISKYSQYFKSVTLVYTRDDEQIISKIFNASLYCYYRDFPQGEIFDVFAIEGSPDSNPIV